MKLIHNWRKGLKFYTVWVYGLIMVLPELYSQLLYSGVIDMYEPPSFVNVLRVLAFIGLVMRFIDQSKPGSEDRRPDMHDTFYPGNNGDAP